MSVQAMAWVIDHSPVEIRGGEYQVMLMIANHIGKTGEAAFAGAATLAAEARLSKQQTLRCIQTLESKSHVIVERGKGRGHLSRYRLPGFERWLQKVKGLDLLPNDKMESPVDHLEQEKDKSVDQLENPKRSHSEAEKVTSVLVKGNICTTPPTPPYKAEPYLTEKQPSPHSRLMRFLELKNGIINHGKEGKAAKAILEHYSPEDAEACYEHLAAEEWRTTAVTWTTVSTQIGTYLKRAADPKRVSADAPHGYDEGGNKILSDHGDWYTIMGIDGTPSKRFRTAEGFAKHSSHSLEEVREKWN